ncbi:MAG: biotin/lipoyl-binding protein [Oscillospiraceae bacterium]
MKKRVVLLLLTAAFMIVCAIAPYIALAAVPNVSIAVPQKTVIKDIVNCSGNIEQADEKNLTMNVPLVASSIHYEVGDTVSKGDVIATIDQQESIKQLRDSQANLTDSYMGVPKEVIEAALAGSATEEQIEKELPSQILSPGNGVDINLKYNQANDPTRPVVTVSASEVWLRVFPLAKPTSPKSGGKPRGDHRAAFEDIYYTATVKKCINRAQKQLFHHERGGGGRAAADRQSRREPARGLLRKRQNRRFRRI